jgi:hypothetical protein
MGAQAGRDQERSERSVGDPIQATSSSSHNDAQGQAQWSANQATGVPNVENYGDNGNAWAPKTPDAGIEWLDLKYPKPVYAEEVRIRESFGPGTIPQRS